MGEIRKDLKKNEEEVRRLTEGCADILLRPMRLGRNSEIECFLIYIETAVSNMMLEDSVIGKLLIKLKGMDRQEVYQALEQNSLGISDSAPLRTMEEAVSAMLAGNAVLFVDCFDQAFKVGSKGYPGAGVWKAESEKVLRGSKEAFSESEKVNTALIRKRIRDTRLKIKETPLGKETQTMTAILYLDGVVYPPFVEEAQRRIEEISRDGVLDSGVLEQLTEKQWYSPFPQYQTTERPDKAAAALLEGRVVLVVDNSPEALILPATFNTLFQASDDEYRHFTVVTFFRLIRYLAAFLAVTLPGLYLAVTMFHTQILPTNLILAMADARKGVPFPGMVEILILELSFELLREAGLRMPGPIGNTIGIVGGLIIGQAAVSANLVSPIVVVVVAMTALGSFSIPYEEMAEAFQLLKYGFIFLGGWFGLLGILFGWMLLVIHLASLKSFGISYLCPFSSFELNKGRDWKDSLVKFPIHMLGRRPIFAREENRKRMGGEE